MGIFFDTMQSAHMLNEELGMSLLNQGSISLGVDNWGKGRMAFGDGKSPPTALWGPEGMGYYCARDVGYTHLLYEIQKAKLQADPDLAKLAKLLVFPGISAVLEMEINGIWVDPERHENRRIELQARQDSLEEELKLFLAEDFRPRADFSNEHFLRRWIFGESPDGLGLKPVAFTDKTRKPKVDEAALAELIGQHPAIEVLVRFRKLMKSIQFLVSWKPWMDRNGRIHPRYNMTGTVTGRRSCSDPNLQQVPRDKYIRTILGAPSGWRFLEVDYSMVEVRIAAWFAEEDTMLKVFSEGRDIYRYTSSIIYKKPESEITVDERRDAKAVVLGFLYGMGPRSFVIYAKETFGAEFTMEQGVEFRETFFNTYPRLVSWHDRQRRIVRRELKVTSPIGRTRHLMRVLSLDQEIRAKAERQAINSPVQGLGGDLTLATSLSLLPEMSKDECLIVGDVHDALLFQLREDVWEKWAHRILTIMEDPPALRPFNMSSPVKFIAEGKIGQYWGAGDEFLLRHFDRDGKMGQEWREKHPGSEYLFVA